MKLNTSIKVTPDLHKRLIHLKQWTKSKSINDAIEKLFMMIGDSDK